MSEIDWPLAIVLAVMFIVMSVMRWRYFKSVMRRRQLAEREEKPPAR